ncbi:MAG TPA: TonB-dependent receptor [Sphingobium sp.]|uniref:TonB-dependent receptor n=1 Tax=Sphingobium sp. TaxID=1912891 RepID=UPI002ED422CE
MIRSYKLRLAVGTALTFVGMGAATAGAQAQEGSADIIVTARRVEERLQDVPISITVLNQQQITNRNINSGADLATYTPSLTANTNFGSQNSSFAIRGFIQAADTAPSVGVYFADVVAPRGASPSIPTGDGAGPGTFFDLQNVQVLKGPQGTLFGRNTTGGAILFVPQKPTGKFEGYVEGSVGNYGMKRIQAVVNVPLSDQARLRIGVDRQTRDGYLKNDTGIGPDRFADIDYTALRASLVVDLTPNLENYTVASYMQSNTTGDTQQLLACNPGLGLGFLACGQLAQAKARGAGFYTVQNLEPNPQSLLTQWQLINTTTWKATDTLTVKNIASYAELRDKFRNPIFGTAFDLSGLGFAPGTAVQFATSSPRAGGYTAAQSTFTEEFRLQGEALGGRLTWQSGAYLEVSNPLATSGAQSPVLLSCTDASTFQCTNPLGAIIPGLGTINLSVAKTSFRNVGLYTQATYSLTDQLKLTGGFRYTWDKQTSNGTLITYQFPALGSGGAITPACTNPGQAYPSCDVHYSTKSSAPTWLIDLDYKPTEDILLYAKYARGYRAGGISVSAPPVVAVFQPEKVDTYEAGFKTSFSGAVRGSFNFSGFYNAFSNQQLQLGLQPADGTTAPAAGILNAGKSRIYGAEVEASITPFHGFTLDASYAYVNAQLQQVTLPDLGGSRYTIVAGQGDPGQEIRYTPRNQVSVTGTYVLPVDESIGRIAFSANYVHVDRFRSAYDHTLVGFPASLDYTPAKDLLNLSLNWNSIGGRPVDLQAFATNVTNKKYVSYVNDVASSGFETGRPAEPRMYGMRLRYNFGK